MVDVITGPYLWILAWQLIVAGVVLTADSAGMIYKAQ